MSSHLQAIATLFSLVNPMVCAMMFTTIVAGRDRATALRSATSAMLSVAAVLMVAAFVGSPLLKLFGISLDAFSVAGGGVLVFIGISMLQGSKTPSTPATMVARRTEGGAPPDIGKLVLFAASPGTITGVMTIVSSHNRGLVPVTAITAIATVTTITWLLLIATTRRAAAEPTADQAPEKPSLARDMVGRYMGLIVVAMGIQFALTGLKHFMAG